MLVITLQPNPKNPHEENLHVVDQETGRIITFKVTEVRGDKVRIGIEASADFRVLRGVVAAKMLGEEELQRRLLASSQMPVHNGPLAYPDLQ